MPTILKNIDHIALEKQRDVLYITFHGKDEDMIQNIRNGEDFDYEQCQKRIDLIAWLQQNHIQFKECFSFSSKSGWISFPYLGEIYLDVPFDETDSQYQLLYEHLENVDGSMKIEGVIWWCYPLEKAIEISKLPEIDWDNF